MHVLVIGASGFIGCKLVNQLAADGKIGDKVITEMTLADVVSPTMPLEDVSFGIRTVKVDITDPASIREILEGRPEVIFHLAAVVSGEAETNFSLGYSVNVDGTRTLLETIRLDESYNPRLVFTSSLAVFGPPLPDVIPDNQACTPRSSYGTQKAIAELMVEDYSRKGFVDGVSIRFPTITVRPGQPNKAASSFISSIIREPVANMPTVCPVPLSVRCTVASPRISVGYLLRAATLAPNQLADGRTLNMPGLSLTVGEMIEALERVTGKHAIELIKHEPDPFITKIVTSWPQELEAKRALSLGFEGDTSYDEVISSYIDDDLGGWKYHLPLGMVLKPVGSPAEPKKKGAVA